MDLKLDSDVWRRVRACAEKAGYSSPEEFVQHLIEKELARLEEEPDGADVERRMRGLGYIE